MAKYNPDEEYHFSESETPVSYTTGPDPSRKDKDFRGRKKGRNIILILAVLMAFWAIYKFMGIFLSQIKQNPKHPVAPVQQPLSKPQPIQPVQQPAQPIRSIQQPIQPIPSAPQMQEISAQKTRLNNLESEMVSLQTTLSDINTKLSDLSNQVSNLSSQANKPPAVVEIKKPVRPKKYPLTRGYGSCVSSCSPYSSYSISCPSSHSSSYSYRLEAAIPGRAWIMRSDGTNLTVSLGDKIPGYGTVIGIDPNEGLVQMSSGATIKYRSHY